ncbi:VanW family protein [Cohnella cellulosilytica]|uniref:VanW family protein n=1 Tax=Cohnella cellulosilytica TaxID=986710 RepID=A0ABW2FAF7_9BACL
MNLELRPVARSPLRLKVGKWVYVTRRYAEWMFGGVRFANRRSAEPLPCVAAQHRTPLMRKLANADMRLQINKVVNLKAAVPRLDGLLLHPGETLSYWRSIGKPTRRKGYVDGMVLFCGQVRTGLAGGLCQLSNLIYWMTLHTELTVTERHRHSYDVFPDASRTQPFGSGATCSYNYLDLRITNRTSSVYQLRLRMDDEYLYGAWHAEQPSRYRYEVRERNHRITLEPWGGYVRNNELYRDVYTADGEWLTEEAIAENHALMMYSPLLHEPSSGASDAAE